VPGHPDGDARYRLARERRVREERPLHAAAGAVEDALGAAVGHEQEVEPPAGGAAAGRAVHDVDAEAFRRLVLREQGRARHGQDRDDAEHDAPGGNRGRRRSIRRRRGSFHGVGDGKQKRRLHWWSTTRLDDLAGQQGYLWTGCHNNASRVLFIGNRMSTGIDNTTYYVLPSHFV
jgi:hypothetical protein